MIKIKLLCPKQKIEIHKFELLSLSKIIMKYIKIRVRYEDILVTFFIKKY